MNLEKFIVQLIEHEGLKLKPYVDTEGKLSIGVGRNLTDRGINRAEAMAMLGRDIDEHVEELRDALLWFDTLDEVRQRVLADMVFNMGLGVLGGKHGLLSFSNTLLLVKNGEYATASRTMLKSDWAQQVGVRAIRLSEMMADGADHPLKRKMV